MTASPQSSSPGATTRPSCSLVQSRGLHPHPHSHPQSSGAIIDMSTVESSTDAASHSATHLAQEPLNESSLPAMSSATPPEPVSTSQPVVQANPLEASKEVIPTAAEATATSSEPAMSQLTTAPTHDIALDKTEEPDAVVTKTETVAIGPSTDLISTPADTGAEVEAGSVLLITLLLTSGARHPYKIDEKYLTKRNVNVPSSKGRARNDPFLISVYTLKELILREWREEWEAKPSSPTSIRLIYFGRLLDDKMALKDCKFNAGAANVVHMTVRPQDVVDEEDASKSKSLARHRETNESTAGCRCVIL